MYIKFLRITNQYVKIMIITRIKFTVNLEEIGRLKKRLDVCYIDIKVSCVHKVNKSFQCWKLQLFYRYTRLKNKFC